MLQNGDLDVERQAWGIEPRCEDAVTITKLGLSPRTRRTHGYGVKIVMQQFVLMDGAHTPGAINVNDTGREVTFAVLTACSSCPRCSKSQ